MHSVGCALNELSEPPQGRGLILNEHTSRSEAVCCAPGQLQDAGSGPPFGLPAPPPSPAQPGHLCDARPHPGPSQSPTLLWEKQLGISRTGG